MINEHDRCPIATRELPAELSSFDAPSWYSAEEALAWAAGWNDCRERFASRA